MAFEYSRMEDGARKDYFKVHGVRFTEFARLPYLDIVRASVIDPMHNMLLGKYLFSFHRAIY